MGVTKRSQEHIMQKIAPTEKFARCVVASIQEHCMDWFGEKITLKKSQKSRKLKKRQKIRMYQGIIKI